MFNPGDKVQWLYTTNRGWGFSGWVNAVVLKVNKKTVRIAAELAKDGTKEVSVKPDKLRMRE